LVAIYFCILVLSTSIRLAYAQSSDQGWTLEQMLERALETSPDVHEALANETVAASQLGRAKAGQLPTASFTGIVSPITAASGNAVDGDTDSDDIGIFSKGDLKIIQPLYTFGRLRNEIRAARQGLLASEAATQKSRHAIIFAIKELYYNLLLSYQIKDLLDDSQENFTTAMETVEERLENDEGNATEQDLLRLRIGVASIQQEQATIEQGIAVTGSALKRQLRIPFQTPFQLASTQLNTVNVKLQPLEHYLSQVDQYRPELAQIEAGLAARQARLEAARSQYYPAIFLAGGFEYSVAPNRDDQDSPFANDYNFFKGPGVALGLNWQLDFWQTRAKVAERVAEVQQLTAQQDAAVSGIALDVERRYLEVKEFEQKVESAQEARKAARALLVTTLANFQIGVGEGKDVFEGLGLYTRIVGDYYKTLRNFNIAAARLTQATGQEVTVPDGQQ
jgi:outer membrane protein TolC